MGSGFKHLVKCRCVMTQFKRLNNPPAHQFSVFSEEEDDGSIKPKYAQCNNCGLIHRVIDICKSEIMDKKEDMSSLVTVEDLKVNLNLSPNIVLILESNSCDLSTWELVSYIVEKKQWGNFVVLTSESESGMVHGKILQILGENLFKVTPFSRQEQFRKE